MSAQRNARYSGADHNHGLASNERIQAMELTMLFAESAAVKEHAFHPRAILFVTL